MGNVQSSKSQFYKEKWFIFLMLFFLAPVGIILLYKFTDYDKNKKKTISIIFGIVWVFMMIITQISSSVEDKEKMEEMKKTIIENSSVEVYNVLEELKIAKNINDVKIDEDGIITLKDNHYDKIVITFINKELISIMGKIDYKDVYYYSNQKIYDIYDYETKKIKEKADENAIKEYEEKLKQEEETRKQNEQEEKAKKELEKKIKYLKKIGFNDTESLEILDILNQVGVSSIDNELIKGAGTGIDELQAYVFDNNAGNRFTITFEKRKVYYIACGSIKLYEYKVLDNISNYTISSNDKVELLEAAQLCVESYLKSPSSAKFPWGTDSYTFGRKGDVAQVKGYVDAKNSYNATIRTNFVVTLNYKSRTCTNVQVQ